MRTSITQYVHRTSLAFSVSFKPFSYATISDLSSVIKSGNCRGSLRMWSTRGKLRVGKRRVSGVDLVVASCIEGFNPQTSLTPSPFDPPTSKSFSSFLMSSVAAFNFGFLRRSDSRWKSNCLIIFQLNFSLSHRQIRRRSIKRSFQFLFGAIKVFLASFPRQGEGDKHQRWWIAIESRQKNNFSPFLFVSRDGTFSSHLKSSQSQ